MACMEGNYALTKEQRLCLSVLVVCMVIREHERFLPLLCTLCLLCWLLAKPTI